MKKVKTSLESVKNQINLLKGKEINLKVNEGRKKIKTFNGKVDKVYPSVFSVTILGGGLKTFSYSDVLCGDVEILQSV